ncbi:MAG: glycosyltransferase family 2 protein [Candidatus Coatesbacteria bacterium]|nr:MAG: glycosyltransferase family 2 protein [Candidatus Coatesbacteria bacterium]
MSRNAGKPSVSACVPALNEAGNVGALVRDLDRVLGGLCDEYEIIVIDDGSTDQTSAVLKELSGELPALRVITHLSNLGYGRALRDGFDAAYCEYVFYTDGDRQFDVGELARFVERAAPGRAVVGYRLERSEGTLRQFTSRAYNKLIQVLFGLKLRDIDCSFKVFPAGAVPSLELKSDRFFIDTELMVKLKNAGVVIEELGVRHLPREYGRSTVSARHVFTTVREIIEMWGELRRKR